MKQINSIRTLTDFQLQIKFEDGTEKRFDLKPYFKFPVFSILKDENIFRSVVNKNYFIEWQNHEIDLSADTLWHEGKTIN
jgi:hypothetical protein